MITTQQKTKAGSQHNEHGVYVKNVKEIKVPFPKAAGKTEVTINLIQDFNDGMWRSSYSLKAGTSASSSLPSIRSCPYQSREDAIKGAAELARIWLLKEVEDGDLSPASKQHVRAALPVLDKWIIANTDSPFCKECGCVPAACRCSKDDEDEEDGFRPGFPPGFDPERAEKGLAQEDKAAEPPTMENALFAALHSVEGASIRWISFQDSGATDAELMEAIRQEFGINGGSAKHGGYSYKGGKSPEFAWPDADNGWKTQVLKGKRLLAKVREVLEIGAPGQPGDLTPDLPSAMDVVKAACTGTFKGGHQVSSGHPLKAQEADDFTAEKKRLHEAAVARWRGERPASADGASNGYQSRMLQMIPVDQIAPSPTNPRKHFDQAKLQELADSISEHGLIEPILVRPRVVSNDDTEYEIIAGERRWRATKLAGLKEIESKVRDLDDKAVLEIQFIENLQRSDLSAIEEAEGYKRLLDEHGYTAESLAGKLAKSKSYVYGRLKLCNLPPAALEALAKGELPATIGELIGRLPSADLRQALWDNLFAGRIEHNCPSFRQVRDYIDTQYMRELKGAGFDQKDAKLYPQAGSCTKCPKRTGNNRTEYPDGRADICTDVSCFKLKTKLSQERQLKAAAGEGATVLSEKESNQWFAWGGELRWDKRNEFVDLAGECEEAMPETDFDNEDDFEDKPGPSHGELLGEIKPDVVGYDNGGVFHRLVKKERAAEILRSRHGIEIEGDADDSPAAGSSDREKEREEHRLLRQARELAVESVAEKVAAWYDQEFLVRSVKGAGGLANLLRTVAGAMLYYFDSSAGIYDTLKRRNPNSEDLKALDEFELSENEAAAKLIENADAADIIGTLAEICARAELHGWVRDWTGDRGTPICDFANLKPADFEKQALGALKPEEPKKKPKPKAKPVATV
jgi:ParB/RepB/Spo0J family partition protein